jgi:hypothetical protein
MANADTILAVAVSEVAKTLLPTPPVVVLETKRVAAVPL